MRKIKETRQDIKVLKNIKKKNYKEQKTLTKTLKQKTNKKKKRCIKGVMLITIKQSLSL